MILASASVAIRKCEPLSKTALVAFTVKAVLPTLMPFKATDQYFCRSKTTLLFSPRLLHFHLCVCHCFGDDP